MNAGKDFFEKNTFVQLHTLNGYEPINQTKFDLLIERNIIEHKGSLGSATIIDLINCIKAKEFDVDKDIFELIFK